VTSFGSTPAYETGSGEAPFYSSDYRLAYMQTVDLGLKVVWKIKPWVAFDAAYDRYTSRPLDGLTRKDAFSQAHSFTLGFKFSH
jgi:hypothetical protein